jgi:hypothetical protein
MNPEVTTNPLVGAGDAWTLEQLLQEVDKITLFAEVRSHELKEVVGGILREMIFDCSASWQRVHFNESLDQWARRRIEKQVALISAAIRQELESPLISMHVVDAVSAFHEEGSLPGWFLDQIITKTTFDLDEQLPLFKRKAFAGCVNLSCDLTSQRRHKYMGVFSRLDMIYDKLMSSFDRAQGQSKAWLHARQVNSWKEGHVPVPVNLSRHHTTEGLYRHFQWIMAMMGELQGWLMFIKWDAAGGRRGTHSNYSRMVQLPSTTVQTFLAMIPTLVRIAVFSIPARRDSGSNMTMLIWNDLHLVPWRLLTPRSAVGVTDERSG